MRAPASSIVSFAHLLVSGAGSPISTRCGSQEHEGSCYSGSWHDLPTGADDIRCWGGDRKSPCPVKPPLTTRSGRLARPTLFRGGRSENCHGWGRPPALWVASDESAT